jgi:hypothetical protein
MGKLYFYKMNHTSILSLVFGGLLTSCQHKPLNDMPKPSPFKISINYEDTAMDCSHCKPIPSPARELGVVRVDWLQAYPTYLEFAVNPKNSNEIVYYQVDRVFKVDMWDLINSVYYYNLKTKNKKRLYTGQLHGKPHWNSSGWVLISQDGQVWKWHPDGSNVLFPANVRINCGAVLNPDGTQFAYPDRQDGFTIADAHNGQLLSRIPYRPLETAYLEWPKPDTLTLQPLNGAVLSQGLKSNQSTLLVPNHWGWGLGFCWLNDSKTMVFSTLTGLYITNTKTKQVKKIKCACQSIRYDCPIYVPQLHKIYALRVETQAINPPQNAPIMTQKKLVSMNIDGSEEQVIDLPQ